MDTQLKEHLNPKKIICLFAALSALCGIASVFVADIFILPLAAFFALLLRFESRKKLCGMIVALGLLLISIFFGVGAIYSVCSGICSGLLLWIMYRARCTKTDTVFVLTAFFTLYLLVALFLAIGNIENNYSLSAAFVYFEEFMEARRVEFIQMLAEIKTVDETGTNHYLFTAEIAEQIFLSIARLTISFFIIAGFLLCGIVCKLFSKIAIYAEKEDSFVRSWRFSPPSIVAYFYLGVFAISIFTAGTQSVFAFAIDNILYVFMAVFAYLGFGFLMNIFKRSERRGSFIMLVFVLIFLLSVSAVQILAFLGAYASIVANRQNKQE